MKKLFATFGLMVGILLAGCTTLNNLTPAQVQSIGIVITQTANQGAAYAIQKDADNAQYFQIAVATLDTFVLGTDLSPAALQTALANVTGNNQWVNLAIGAVVVAYDFSYQQYVAGQVNKSAVAVAWITAAETGFKQALAVDTGLRSGPPVVPYFVKVSGSTVEVDKAAVEDKVKDASK